MPVADGAHDGGATMHIVVAHRGGVTEAIPTRTILLRSSVVLSFGLQI